MNLFNECLESSAIVCNHMRDPFLSLLFFIISNLDICLHSLLWLSCRHWEKSWCGLCGKIELRANEWKVGAERSDRFRADSSHIGIEKSCWRSLMLIVATLLCWMGKMKRKTRSSSEYISLMLDDDDGTDDVQAQDIFHYASTSHLVVAPSTAPLTLCRLMNMKIWRWRLRCLMLCIDIQARATLGFSHISSYSLLSFS